MNELIVKILNELRESGLSPDLDWIRVAGVICESLSRIEELEGVFDLETLMEASEELYSIFDWLESNKSLEEWLEEAL